MTAAIVHRVSVFPLCIPLHWKVTSARAECRVADPVVVSVELTSGAIGYGETLPRRDLTDETVESVVAALCDVLTPALMEFHPASFPEALEAIEALPWHDKTGHPIPAARAPIDLGLLDATMRTYDRDVDDLVQWMGLPGFGSPGSLHRARFSGLLAHDDEASMLRHLRRLYWHGVRSFTLKVGMQGDLNRLRRVESYLRGPLASNRATLTVDADGWWSKDEAIDWLSDAQGNCITAIEQPVPRGDEEDLCILRDLFEAPVIADESVVTAEDAQRLIDLRAADGFNISLSKCGGLIPSLRIAALGRRAGLDVRLGCMLGETSLLSAAGVRFLQVCPSVSHAEGSLGSLLLSDDIAAKSLRFGYGGRLPRLAAGGLGAEADPLRLQALCDREPVVMNL